MFYSYPQEVLQEVPGEISLALSISGCPLRCKGCHSTETYKSDFGTELTEDELNRLLKKHKHISCVLFYGGEWDFQTLTKMTEIVNKKGLKRALFTGYGISFFNREMLNKFDFIKVGKYDESLGGLSSKNTNQQFFKLKNGLIEEEVLFNT